MPERRFKPRVRQTNIRDARLIIIAAEGTNTEKQYLTALVLDERYRNPKVHVEVLEREKDASAPEHIITLLDQFRRKYSLTGEDELWLVIDVDRWGSAKLSRIATECGQKGYLLAVSNPCFELWLLLHVADFDTYTAEKLQEFFENKKTNNRTCLETELLALLGEYNKSKLKPEHFLPHVETAVERSQKLDINPDHSWPNQLGTRVYRVVQSIIDRTRR